MLAPVENLGRAAAPATVDLDIWSLPLETVQWVVRRTWPSQPFGLGREVGISASTKQGGRWGWAYR
jgi:hypothetical protein